MYGTEFSRFILTFLMTYLIPAWIGSVSPSATLRWSHFIAWICWYGYFMDYEFNETTSIRDIKSHELSIVMFISACYWYIDTSCCSLLIIVNSLIFFIVQMPAVENESSWPLLVSCKDVIYRTLGSFCPCVGPTPFYALTAGTSTVLQSGQYWKLITLTFLHGMSLFHP